MASTRELDRIFQGLKSRDLDERLQCAQDLRSHLASAVAEMKSEADIKRWSDDVNSRLFELMHSNTTAEALGGLEAISQLLDIDEESSRNLFRFWNYVKYLLPNQDVSLMLAASRTLGKIAKIGGASFGERFMDKEVPGAIQMMQQDSSRYAGVLILAELARNSSTYFYSHVPFILEHLLTSLRDRRQMVREGAASLLAACLEVLTSREKQTRNPYMSKLLEDAQMGLKQAPPEIIHGSLLVYRELMLHGGMFMRETFLDVTEQILRFKSHSDPLIRSTVVTTIPILAAYDTDTFTKHLLHSAMNLLLTQLEKPGERAESFTAIGQVASYIGGDMKPFLPSIMDHIRKALINRGQKNSPPEEAIFRCIGMLAIAVGPNMTKLLQEQLNLMLACGLSEALRQALSDISRCIPILAGDVHYRLLNLISHTLSSEPYHRLGSPAAAPGDMRMTTEAIISAQTAAHNKTPRVITLALTTLGTFDFTGHTLNEFARSCALPYIDDDDPEIRRAAALSCCHIFVDDPTTYQSSTHSTQVITEVLDKLIKMAIADPEPRVRHTVLTSLHPRFDRHLSQAENLRALFLALNDEAFENRVAAVSLVSRLANHNPAYVAPSLRNTMIQLLTELEYSTIQRRREEGTRLLTLLVNVNLTPIKAYALPMLQMLIGKAGDRNPTVAANILLCLGELVGVVGEEAIPHLPAVIKIVVSRLSDPILSKRDAAIHSLGQICLNAGYVIEPLADYPQILEILERILRTDNSPGVRREVVRLLGIMGAIDPYRHKSSLEYAGKESATRAISGPPKTNHGDLSGTSMDDYFQDVVFSALLAILNDPLLSTYHTAAIEAIMSIFKIQGMKCIATLPQVIPAFISVTRNSQARLGFYLEQLTILVGIVKLHVRNFMPELSKLFVDLWENFTARLSIVAAMDALATVFGAEFAPFLPSIFPLLLKEFNGEVTDGRVNLQVRILELFLTVGNRVQDYLYLVLPIILRSCERREGKTTLLLQTKALQTIKGLTRHINLTDHASPIIHSILRVFESADQELRTVAMETMCSLVVQLGPEFVVFIPTIEKTLSRLSISHAQYKDMVRKVLNGERLHEESVLDVIGRSHPLEHAVPVESKPSTIHQEHLKAAWNTFKIKTLDEWNQWIHCLEVELIKEAPPHPIRACMTLGNTYPPLARDLFNAAFLSCWSQMYEYYQEDLLRSIESALTSDMAPIDVIYRLLNLAEFMERQGQPLPIDNRTFGDYAMGCAAYAKAVHYKELEFLSESSPVVVESLISLNTRLEQHDTAWGMFVMARDQYDITKHEEWYERLGYWDDALAAYDEKLAVRPHDTEITLGRLRCLHALGEWDDLATSCGSLWSTPDPKLRKAIAPMAVAAAWALQSWDMMDNYSTGLRSDSPDLPFYRAILAVHRNQFPKALGHIARARDLLSPELKSFVGENYTRSYNTLVRAQMLSELEEIIVFKQSNDQPGRQNALRRTWMKRLCRCKPDVDVWQRILQVRTLVLSPENDTSMWTKFANLCRKSNRMVLAEKVLDSLLSPMNRTKAPPHVVYSQLKFMWARGVKEETLEFLRQFASSLLRDIQVASSRLSPSNDASKAKLSDLSKLLARCYYKMGEWQVELGEDWGGRDIKDILQSYDLATRSDPAWYKAWHVWALTNFDVVGYIESQSKDYALDGPHSGLVLHIVQAVDGFFHAISLRGGGKLQDTLRLLTLWFKYGSDPHVEQAISAGIPTVEVDTWLDVIPQLIARIQTPHAQVQRHINVLLTEVGKHHPQALIYALMVASQSSSAPRRNAALAIMSRMQDHSPNIVNQALMVSRELLRVAILWHELWHNALEEASRQFYVDKDPEAMIATLEPLYEMMDAGPTTARETSFAQTYGKELREAREACRGWRIDGNGGDMDRAWDIYASIFKRIDKHLASTTTLDLQFASPSLHQARDLDLAVPGTYKSGRPIVRIISFAPNLSIIHSKQRLRRLVIKGSDGVNYQYGLKGHEDLRQDERVMQLLGLINYLLSADADSFKRRLHIQRYPIIPLAPNAGLMGWVENTDTLHALIRDYRQPRKVLINLEYRLMTQFAPDYELLQPLQKVETFEHALMNTSGDDLYRMFWLKSTNSEHWLERRTNYTRSLAVNSMAGHILGLGDRHPSNLLIKRDTGKVVHIDFGDCFEVAMHRDAYPEKVPFRLTRMLVHAMEVSRIEGSFRKTSEITMRVLRNSKESLMAVLEAFVYDPLITWRLMKTETDGRQEQSEIVFDSKRTGDLTRVPPHPQGHTRKLKTDERDIFNDTEGQIGALEVRNERALVAYNRVQHKLNGREFDPNEALSVERQVERLIQQATSIENLCQAFVGWCAFW